MVPNSARMRLDSICALKPELPRRPAGEGLRQSDHAPVIGSLDQRLVDGARIIGGDRPQRDFRLDSASRSPNKEAPDDRVLRRAPRPRARRGSGRDRSSRSGPREPGRSCRPARDEARAPAAKPASSACSIQAAVGSPVSARSGSTLTTMSLNLRPLWARAPDAAPVKRKPECAKGGERAPASHGAGDHFVLSFRPSDPTEQRAKSGRPRREPRPRGRIALS